MASGLFNCYESAADVRSTKERHLALETKTGLQHLLLLHSLSLSLPAWHATVTLARGGTHDVLVLRKRTGAVTLGGTVERAQLLFPCDSVRSSQSTGPRAGRVPTTVKI